MTALSLVPLGSDSFSKVAHIHVAPEQEKFSGQVADAFVEAEEGVDFHAIMEGEEAVGFFKIDRLYFERYPFAQFGELGLRGFLIDKTQQGRGVATGAVRLMPHYLPSHYPKAPALVLTVNCANPAAIACYLKGGFVDTSDIWPHGQAGPQHIMRMQLKN